MLLALPFSLALFLVSTLSQAAGVLIPYAINHTNSFVTYSHHHWITRSLPSASYRVTHHNGGSVRIRFPMGTQSVLFVGYPSAEGTYRTELNDQEWDPRVQYVDPLSYGVHEEQARALFVIRDLNPSKEHTLTITNMHNPSSSSNKVSALTFEKAIVNAPKSHADDGLKPRERRKLRKRSNRYAYPDHPSDMSSREAPSPSSSPPRPTFESGPGISIPDARDDDPAAYGPRNIATEPTRRDDGSESSSDLFPFTPDPDVFPFTEADSNDVFGLAPLQSPPGLDTSSGHRSGESQDEGPQDAAQSSTSEATASPSDAKSSSSNPAPSSSPSSPPSSSPSSSPSSTPTSSSSTPPSSSSSPSSSSPSPSSSSPPLSSSASSSSSASPSSASSPSSTASSASSLSTVPTSNSPVDAPDSSNVEHKSGLSPGVIAVVVILTLVGVATIIFGAIYFYLDRKKHRAEMERIGSPDMGETAESTSGISFPFRNSFGGGAMATKDAYPGPGLETVPEGEEYEEMPYPSRSLDLGHEFNAYHAAGYGGNAETRDNHELAYDYAAQDEVVNIGREDDERLDYYEIDLGHQDRHEPEFVDDDRSSHRLTNYSHYPESMYDPNITADYYEPESVNQPWTKKAQQNPL